LPGWLRVGTAAGSAGLRRPGPGWPGAHRSGDPRAGARWRRGRRRGWGGHV